MSVVAPAVVAQSRVRLLGNESESLLSVLPASLDTERRAEDPTLRIDLEEAEGTTRGSDLDVSDRLDDEGDLTSEALKGLAAVLSNLRTLALK